MSQLLAKRRDVQRGIIDYNPPTSPETADHGDGDNPQSAEMGERLQEPEEESFDDFIARCARERQAREAAEAAEREARENFQRVEQAAAQAAAARAHSPVRGKNGRAGGGKGASPCKGGEAKGKGASPCKGGGKGNKKGFLAPHPGKYWRFHFDKDHGWYHGRGERTGTRWWDESKAEYVGGGSNSQRGSHTEFNRRMKEKKKLRKERRDQQDAEDPAGADYREKSRIKKHMLDKNVGYARQAWFAVHWGCGHGLEEKWQVEEWLCDAERAAEADRAATGASSSGNAWQPSASSSGDAWQATGASSSGGAWQATGASWSGGAWQEQGWSERGASWSRRRGMQAPPPKKNERKK